MTSDHDEQGREIAAYIEERLDKTACLVAAALCRPDPVTWTGTTIEIAREILELQIPPGSIVRARHELEDLHWSILSGIAAEKTTPSPI